MQYPNTPNPQKQPLQPVLLGAGQPTLPLERGRSDSAREKGDPASAPIGYYPVPVSGRSVPLRAG